ncbi:MAG: phenylacetate--CoA ligase family protein [Saprospiraceae bacterium]|nr:phenylacetate--CoA ligase family protein [Saprospiraceae bacterium]
MRRILEKIIFPLGDRLLGTSVSKELITQRSYTKLSESALAKLQHDKLNALLKHATSTCKFYKPYNTVSTNPYEWLKIFPIIKKSDTTDLTEELLSEKYKNKKLLKYETSGSSGVRAVVFVDKKEQSIFRAILINWWEWTGFYLGKPIFQTGMSPRRRIVKTIKDRLTNTYYFPAFNFDSTTATEHLNKIKDIKNLHLGGYASSLYVLALIAEEKKLNIQFDAAISWGDKMFDHYREKIESIFKTKVYENYSCNEGIMIAQKVDLPYFYIYTPNVYLELLDQDNQPVKDGEMGRVIVTKLDGYAMPLIRYDTGDLAIKLPISEYPEKRKFNFPLLKMVIGRNTDIIKTSDGKNLIVHTFTGIFEFYPEIKQFKIIQESYDSIIIEYIPSNDFTTQVLARIVEDIHTKTNSSIEIQWKKVDSIANTASGKPQLIENRLIKNSLTTAIK